MGEKREEGDHARACALQVEEFTCTSSVLQTCAGGWAAGAEEGTAAYVVAARQPVAAAGSADARLEQAAFHQKVINFFQQRHNVGVVFVVVDDVSFQAFYHKPTPPLRFYLPEPPNVIFVSS